MYTFSEIAKWTSRPWKNSKGAGSACFQGSEKHLRNSGKKKQTATQVLGISHDTRTLKAGEVYLAIRGENHDGHDFVEQAVTKGAVGLIVEKSFPNVACPEPGRRGNIPQLIVPDTLAALWQMAAGVRREWSGTVIGITGSAGKTTVKEMAASVLSQKGTVAKTRGNWNNDFGLPLSMLAADRDADFFVFELGMNHPGEIDRLASLLRPDWALITNIGKAHIEFFQPAEPGRAENVQTLGKIADEKAAILKHASHAILDADSEWFDRLQTGFQGRVVPLTEELFSVSQPGAHMIQNARFAATLGLELGLSSEEVQAGLRAFSSVPLRWEETEQAGIVFINDAYNANPLSMCAALSTFAELPCAGRKFVVLGGMRELGAESEAEHRELGLFVDSLKFDGVITIGEAGAQIGCEAMAGIEKSAAVQVLRETLRAGDKVLFKASRGERLETLLEELQRRFTKS